MMILGTLRSILGAIYTSLGGTLDRHEIVEADFVVCQRVGVDLRIAQIHTGEMGVQQVLVQPVKVLQVITVDFQIKNPVQQDVEL